jgi:hypothetical protein
VVGDPGGRDGGEERVVRVKVDGSDEEIVPPALRLARRDPPLPAVDVYRVDPVAGSGEAGGEVRSAMDGIEDEDLHGMG